MTALDLSTSAVLTRAANLIITNGHAKKEFHTNDGYCAAGAITSACGLDPDDWFDSPIFAPAARNYECELGGFYRDAYEADLQAWKTRRQAALDAARALAGHITPDAAPEQMSRREVSEHLGDWNDHPDRTPARVATAMRDAARQGVTHG